MKKLTLILALILLLASTAMANEVYFQSRKETNGGYVYEEVTTHSRDFSHGLVVTSVLYH